MTSIQPQPWVARAGAAVTFHETAFGATVLHVVGDRGGPRHVASRGRSLENDRADGALLEAHPERPLGGGLMVSVVAS